MKSVVESKGLAGELTILDNNYQINLKLMFYPKSQLFVVSKPKEKSLFSLLLSDNILSFKEQSR